MSLKGRGKAPIALISGVWVLTRWFEWERAIAKGRVCAREKLREREDGGNAGLKLQWWKLKSIDGL